MCIYLCMYLLHYESIQDYHQTWVLSSTMGEETLLGSRATSGRLVLGTGGGRGTTFFALPVECLFSKDN